MFAMIRVEQEREQENVIEMAVQLKLHRFSIEQFP